MARNPWLVLPAALVVWMVYFYVIDVMIMEGQGLPVTWILMPA